MFLKVTEGFDDIVRLHRALQSGPLEQDLEFDFHPHVTVAHDVSAAGMDAAASELAGYDAAFTVRSMGLYEHDETGMWKLREELGFGDDGSAAAERAGRPDPLDRSGPRTGSGEAKTYGSTRLEKRGMAAESRAYLQLMLARLDAFRPMRTWQLYGQRNGPLMAAGSAYKMFFSIAAMLVAGFSILGLVAAGNKPLRDLIVQAVSSSTPGLIDTAAGDWSPRRSSSPRAAGSPGRWWSRPSPWWPRRWAGSTGCAKACAVSSVCPWWPETRC